MDFSGTTISSLPAEMIERMFEYLSFRDRLTASRTCRAWQQIAFSVSFCRAMRIKIEDCNCWSDFQDFRAYKKCRNACVSLATACNICDHQNISSELKCLVRTAPLESLSLSCRRESMKAILDDHMLRMSALTAVNLCVAKSKQICVDDDEFRISHPSLESLSIDDQSRLENFTINCPKVIELTIVLNSMRGFHVVTQLQKQLQTLKISSHSDDQCLEELENVEFSNLKKLCLTFSKTTGFTAPSFKRMTKLVNLAMHNQSSYYMKAAEELSILTCLSKLTLSGMAIDTEGFSKALREMTWLRKLVLFQCRFVSPTQSCAIESEHVEHLHIHYVSKDSQLWLPSFPKLRTLSLSKNFGEEIDDTFERICRFYPELEKLRFAAHITIQKFRSKTTFSHIWKLKHLKRLHLFGLNADYLDWTACSQLAIEELRLDRCLIRGTEAHQLIASIGKGLRRFTLKQCDLHQPLVDMFDLHECRGFEGLRLRRLIPWCKVSYYHCSVIAERWQGRASNSQRSEVVVL